MSQTRRDADFKALPMNNFKYRSCHCSTGVHTLKAQHAWYLFTRHLIFYILPPYWVLLYGVFVNKNHLKCTFSQKSAEQTLCDIKIANSLGPQLNPPPPHISV